MLLDRREVFEIIKSDIGFRITTVLVREGHFEIYFYSDHNLCTSFRFMYYVSKEFRLLYFVRE